jgi:hypothetical protein
MVSTGFLPETLIHTNESDLLCVLRIVACRSFPAKFEFCEAGWDHDTSSLARVM